jgi:pimeloyl-ACP methyl ester carboxylesterase
MKVRVSTFVLVGLLELVSKGSMSAQPAPESPLIPALGQYSVGFKLVEQYDLSRGFTLPARAGAPAIELPARPLQTLIWYPASQQKVPDMTFRDYVVLTTREVNFSAPLPKEGDVVMGDAFRPHYDEHMQTHLDAEPVAGRFPVIIYAPSSSSFSWENVDLCRYLASHGYLVIASPGMGVGRQSTGDLASADAQALDISFLVGYAHGLNNADTSRVAAVGFSWGGLSALVAAMRDSRLKALVAMDGSFRYVPWIVSEAKGIQPGLMTLPLLFFKGQWSLEDQEREYRKKGPTDLLSPNVLNAWAHGDLINVQMLGMAHPEFNSATHRLDSFWEKEFPRLQQADYDRRDGRVGYSWVARYTLAFLDFYLKNDARAAAFLKSAPRDNGVPAHTMAVTVHKAEPMSPVVR